MKYFLSQVTVLLLCSISILAADLFIEAESFDDKGGWVLDTQFQDQMGSCYLMAHGLGNPVQDAQTKVSFNKTARYHLYVRTFNWTSPWTDQEGPGKFQVSVGDNKFDTVLGTKGSQWEWQYAGCLLIEKGETQVTLHDLTGFNGRCDALYFTTRQKDIPPNSISKLTPFRKTKLHFPRNPENAGTFDLVVVGGGIAGMSASIAAARLGARVALIQNRPLVGGNNSSEIRVHLGGRIETLPYPNLGNLQKEFGPLKEGNAQPADNYEDQKKLDALLAEPNITLFLNHHVFAAEKKGNKISRILARNTHSSREYCFSAPVFADCTGDGTLGFLTGADFRMGREARSEYQESLAPEIADPMTLGASIQWYSLPESGETSFPLFQYGLNFNQENSQKVTMGEWTWETGLNRDQISEAEFIRDYGLLVVFSNWSYLKNESNDPKYTDRSLKWVAYIAGKRESRRLLGDLVLTENDLRNFHIYPDAAGSTTWSIDLHYPDPKNTKYFPGNEFKTIAVHENIHPYPVPYRCLYSRNVENLFMAGRDISVSHVVLGTTRVMRTCGIMGEVVGMAASLCKTYQVSPRSVYLEHLDELKTLMQKGVGQSDLPNTQTYNMGGTLGTHPNFVPKK